MDFAAIISYVATNWDSILAVALQVLGVASVVARITPTEVDNKIIDTILGVVHKLGLTKPPAPPAA